MQNSQPLHSLFISRPETVAMRCDLHVHSVASGMFDAPGLGFCRESYSDPVEVYQHLKRRGMSLVTITDHDSIDAAEELRGYRDFFLSEEVTVTMPSGTLMHLGVYGINERDHAEIQKRRKDFFALRAYLRERKLFFSINHAFSGLTGKRREQDFDLFRSAPAIEIRNGQMWQGANSAAEQFAARQQKIGIGGSDSHTIDGVGKTYTEVPDARSAEEFLSALRCGHGIIGGTHGSYASLTADVYRIVQSMVSHQPRTLPLAPLAVFVPLFTAVHWLNEVRFCRHWSAKMMNRDQQVGWRINSPLEPTIAG